MFFEGHSDARSAIVASAAVLQEIMTLYDTAGLSIAAAHLSSALDSVCEAGLDSSMPVSPAVSTSAVS
jgi:hypothetical protein